MLYELLHKLHLYSSDFFSGIYQTKLDEFKLGDYKSMKFPFSVVLKSSYNVSIAAL